MIFNIPSKLVRPENVWGSDKLGPDFSRQTMTALKWMPRNNQTISEKYFYNVVSCFKIYSSLTYLPFPYENDAKNMRNETPSISNVVWITIWFSCHPSVWPLLAGYFLKILLCQRFFCQACRCIFIFGFEKSLHWYLHLEKLLWFGVAFLSCQLLCFVWVEAEGGWIYFVNIKCTLSENFESCIYANDSLHAQN